MRLPARLTLLSLLALAVAGCATSFDPRSEQLNSESAIVFLQPELSRELRTRLLDGDLRYAREITPEQAAGFEAPASVIERFRKSLGELFEQQL